ncbi:MAG: MFS transporter [Desulfovibrionaceae bacterium]|nr:MFS transporter [Desulfovibrionaceae bacterium]
MNAPDNKRHIVVFAVIAALCLIGDSMLYIVLPVHAAELGLALWEVGIILAVNRLVRLPLNPCIGWLYSHISERTGILIAITLAAATTFSYGFLPNLAFWILARCVWGVAWTLLRLGSLFCILRLSGPENRGHYTGLFNGLYRLGSLVGMFLGGVLADIWGMQVTAVVFGLLTSLSFFLALAAIPKGKNTQEEYGHDTGIRAGLALLGQDRKVLWIVAGGGLVAFVIQGVIASTLSKLIDVHTAGGIGLAGTLIGAATLAGFFQALRWGWEPWLAPFAGRMSDQHFGRPRMLCWAFAAGAGMLALLALPLPLLVWFMCILGMQLTATVLTTISDATASDAASLAGGRALLMMYALIVDVGAAVGPLVAYGMNEFFGINAVYLLSAGLFALLWTRWRGY